MSDQPAERPTPETDGVFGPELFGIRARTCRRIERERDEAREQRDRLEDTLNDLWHHYSLTGAAYELIETALKTLEGGTE